MRSIDHTASFYLAKHECISGALRFILLFVTKTPSSYPLAVANPEPLVTIPELGTLKGMSYPTIGLGPSKDYYQFKNIPYADSVAGEKRFTVSFGWMQNADLGLLYLIYVECSFRKLKR